MSVQHCSNCSRANPPEARYCFYDGVSLAGSVARRPSEIAYHSFPQPFALTPDVFCQNFDQLALACQLHWGSARDRLKDGSLDELFRQVGRADLAMAARAAAAYPDPDLGLDMVLERLPQRSLQPANLDVHPAEENLGKLEPATPYAFQIQLANTGHRLIHGTVTIDCPWLLVKGGAFQQPFGVSFPEGLEITVVVVSSKMVATPKPMRAEILIETNAGSKIIPVSAHLPVLAFAKGVLKGSKTPREIALKAKSFPKEAGELFRMGEVKAWYERNQWIYPVSDQVATGMAAVQQYFEALGLTQPPKVRADKTRIVMKGKPGDLIRQSVILRTDENKPVYASGTVRSDWVSIRETVCKGNQTTITVEGTVPEFPPDRGAEVIALVANGNQRFTVPIEWVVQIDPASPVAPVRAELFEGLEPVRERRSILPWIGIFFGFLILVGGLAGWWVHRDWHQGRASLEPYVAAISPSTVGTLLVDFEKTRRILGLGEKEKNLFQSLRGLYADLDLQGESLDPKSAFVRFGEKEGILTITTFGAPVSFGKVHPTRYKKVGELYADQYLHNKDWAWSIDRSGRLVGGPISEVTKYKAAEASGERSETFGRLASAAFQVPSEVSVWGTVDPAKMEAMKTWMPHLDNAKTFNGPWFCFHLAEPQGQGRFLVRAKGEFASQDEGVRFREFIKSIPARKDGDPLQTAVGRGIWIHEDQSASFESTILGSDLAGGLEYWAEAWRVLASQAKDRLKQAGEADISTAQEEFKAGRYDQAIVMAEATLEKFPGSPPAIKLRNEASNKRDEKREFEKLLEAGKEYFRTDALFNARSILNQLKKSALVDSRVKDFEEGIAQRENEVGFATALEKGKAAFASQKLLEAGLAYRQALKYRPVDPDAKLWAEALEAIQLADQSLRNAATANLDVEFEPFQRDVNAIIGVVQKTSNGPFLSSQKQLAGLFEEAKAKTKKMLVEAHPSLLKFSKVYFDLAESECSARQFSRSTANFQKAGLFLERSNWVLDRWLEIDPSASPEVDKHEGKTPLK